MTTGFLHPGAMGAAVAAACADEGLWAGEGRSTATAQRAAEAGLDDVGTVEALAQRCDTIVSICPPAAAVEVAESVAAAGFDGRYLDANAIAPDTARRIGELFGDRFVDGGLIGPPPTDAGQCRLYLAGPAAADVATGWDGSHLDVRIVDGAPGAASALKMAYAGWTKGSAALLLAMRAYAAAEGVESDLVAEWAVSQPRLDERSRASAAAVAPKAWRFVGEMDEIAASLRAAGLPGHFHEGAAEIYRAIAGDADVPVLGEVLSSLRGDPS